MTPALGKDGEDDATSETPLALRPHGRCVWPSYFNAPVWFAYLLRGDVRGSAAFDDEEARKRFLLWFFCFGRTQYLSAPPSDEQRRIVWESVPALHSPRARIQPRAIPRILAYLLDNRADVFQATRADEPDGLDRAIGWLFLHGLREFDLYDLLDDRVRDWLNSPVDADRGSDLPITNLAMLVWFFRQDLQPLHDLATVESRRRFTAWVYSAGLREETLLPLLSREAVDALERRISVQEGHGVSQHAYLCWLAGLPGVPSAPPATARAAAALDAWYAEARPTFFAKPSPLPGATRPVPWTDGPPVRRGCNLIGYAYGELGVGEDVRMMAAALRSNEVPFTIADCSADLRSRASDRSAAGHVAEGLPHAATVFCFTGFDTGRILLQKGTAAIRGRHSIGYWPWELPRWPKAWNAAFGLVDEIWVSSRFTEEAFCLEAPVPVIHMPMAVEIPMVAPLTRHDFGLPDGRFLFLYVFDAHSYLDRKNPMAAVAAFRRAFPHGNEPVGLVLKVMNAASEHPVWQAVLQQTAADPRIRVIADTLDKPQALALTGLCDAYLSLHRAEGFGRTIAEAMLLAKPVIATAWSGSDELVRPDTAMPISAALIPIGPDQYPWGEGMVWAEPDLDHAAWAMQLLVADAGLRARLGAAGQALVRQRHNARTVGRRYRERLAALDLL